MTVRTLIVDDDARVADIHKGYVERVDGFVVAGVANRGTEALRRVLDDKPDLVLLDIYLPDLGGLEVCRRLRAAGNLVDVIAVTAARDVDTVKGAVGLGVAQYLVKPFTFATFRDKLERYAAYRALAERGRRGRAGARSTRCSASCAPPARRRSRRASPRRRSTSWRGRSRQATTPLERGRDRGAGRAEPRHRPPLPRAPLQTQQVELELRYGGSGRPEHRYRWTHR